MSDIMKTVGAQAGILFDFNGVLANDEHLHEQAFAWVLRNHGVTLSHSVYRHACLGRTDLEGFEALSREFPAQLAKISLGQLIAEKNSQYAQLVAGTDIFYPGVVPMLRCLAKHFRLAIVTSSQRGEVHSALLSRSILKLFEFLVTSEDVANGKPHPECYAIGAARLALPTARIVVVEDSPSGVLAAKAAGLKCIAVLQTSPYESLTQADVSIDKAAEIDLALIQRVLEKEGSEQ